MNHPLVTACIALALLPATLVADDDSRAQSIHRAADWLLRHRTPVTAGGRSDLAMWRASNFLRACKTPCANAGGGEGRGNAGYDIGVSGLAMLALSSASRYLEGPKAVECLDALRASAEFLAVIQNREEDHEAYGAIGAIDVGNSIYNHALATYALAEYLLLSPGEDVEKRLKPALRLAAEFCLRARNEKYGWQYGIKPGRNSTALTGWMALAVEAASRVEGVNLDDTVVAESRAGALNWFNRATAVKTGKTGYIIPGDEGARNPSLPVNAYPFSKEMSAMTAEAVACRLVLGEEPGSQVIRRGLELLLSRPPEWREKRGRTLSTINFYYWYFGTRALGQARVRTFSVWREAAEKTLIGNQRKGGDEDGSWDPIGEWGSAGGRVYSTALGLLTLLPLDEGPDEEKRAIDDFALLGRNARGYFEYRHERSGLRFVSLPGGRFTMGSPESEPGRGETERPNEVELDPFLIATHEVSQDVWEEITGSNPSTFKRPDRPVETVSWRDALSFCRKLKLTLPTEAQWEYACRAGTTTAFSTGDALGPKDANAGDAKDETTTIGTYEPNAFGLFDMHGNVSEWCRDVLADSYLKGSKRNGARQNPLNSRGSDDRVYRGGSWRSKPEECRSAARAGDGRLSKKDDRGLRPVFRPRR